MTKKITIIALLMLVALQALGRNERDTLGIGTQVVFVRNDGQWDSRVRYEAQLHDAALFLEDDGLTVALRTPQRHPAPGTGRRTPMHAYKMLFAGASATPAGEAQQPGYSNYFLGSNPARWRSRVPSYAVARYSNLYPGIDLELYTASNALKYNFIVHPGADPSTIAIEYLGTDGVSIVGDGNLRIRTTVRDIVELKPYVYQEEKGDGRVEREVKSRWRLSKTDGGYRATVEIGDYDRTRDLVIDPVVQLRFSTYTGSLADNWGTTGTYDSHKNTYTAGLVFDIGYPTSLGAYDTTFNSTAGIADIGIFKFDSTGSQRLYATYLGGAQADMPHSLYVNNFDELLILGTTGSNDFPTTADAYRRGLAGGTGINYENAQTIAFPNGSDIFVARLSPDGTTLQASTLIGGNDNDGLNYKRHYNRSSQVIMQGNDTLYHNYGDGARGEIISDIFGNTYVSSTTMSANFPTTAGAAQRNYVYKQDAVVFKLDYALHTLLWSTYLGGSGDDAAYSIDLDDDRNPVVCGGTASSDFPVTAGTHQTTYGGGTADGFVAKLSTDDGSLIASTFTGSAAYDQAYFVRVGNDGETFIFGQTKAQGSAMIHNAGYSVPSSGMLLQRLSPALDTLRWSTVFGTPGRINLSPTAFAADICNRVYAAGWGRDFVVYNGVQWYTMGTTGMQTTPDAYADSTDGQDFYIIAIDADANQLDYATFFGELHRTDGYSLNGADHVDGGTSRFDRLATLYQSVCASCGGTQNFPTTAGAWSDTNRSSNCNNAIFRFNVRDDFPVAEFLAPQAGCAPYTVSLRHTGRGTSFLWDFGDGTTSTDPNPTHTYTAAGTYTITLTAYMAGGCSNADVQSRQLLVIEPSEGFTHPVIIACNGAAVPIGVTPQPGATYTWLGGNIETPNIANPSVSQAGTYILRTQAQGCSQTDTFKVTVQHVIVADSLIGNSCRDSADGRLILTVEAGISPAALTYHSSPTLPTHTTDTTIVFDSLAPGVEYTVTVIGPNCEYTHRYTLANKPRPNIERQESQPLCHDTCAGWYRITLDGHDTLFSGLCEGTYYDTLIDADGCPVAITTHIRRNHALDSLRAWADDSLLWDGESTMLHATVSSSEAVGYLWSPAATLESPDAADALATPTDSVTVYTVTATSGGCSRTAKVTVRCTPVVCGAPLFTIPNAFTPNGDGTNDAVCFNNEQIAEFTIAIFNRWGEAVYRSDDPTGCWDGTYRGTPCPAGVYTYTCHITCFGNHTNDMKGNITLIR